ncbi:DUF1456 family protein [Leucothrix sargassi]|nr:DUF1456 family protein [Leucothrix sargassi]
MDNNDVLRRLRYSFEFDDSTMIKLFQHCEVTVTRAQVSAWLKRDDDPEMVKITDAEMATFLNGFIVEKRGKKNGQTPAPETKLNNNIVLAKLKIALSLQSEDILALLTLAGLPISKHELSAFFRKNSHKHYRSCKDQILRHFLKGVQMKYHDGIEPEVVEPVAKPVPQKTAPKPKPQAKQGNPFQWRQTPPTKEE